MDYSDEDLLNPEWDPGDVPLAEANNIRAARNAAKQRKGIKNMQGVLGATNGEIAGTAGFTKAPTAPAPTPAAPPVAPPPPPAFSPPAAPTPQMTPPGGVAPQGPAETALPAPPPPPPPAPAAPPVAPPPPTTQQPTAPVGGGLTAAAPPPPPKMVTPPGGGTPFEEITPDLGMKLTLNPNGLWYDRADGARVQVADVQSGEYKAPPGTQQAAKLTPEQQLAANKTLQFQGQTDLSNDYNPQPHRTANGSVVPGTEGRGPNDLAKAAEAFLAGGGIVQQPGSILTETVEGLGGGAPPPAPKWNAPTGPAQVSSKPAGAAVTPPQATPQATAPTGGPSATPSPAPTPGGISPEIAAMFQKIFASAPQTPVSDVGSAQDAQAGELAGIDPESDLMSSSVLPADDPYTSRLRDSTTTALDNVMNVDRTGLSGELRKSALADLTPNDPRLSKYNTMVDEQAGKLAGVDRFKLAQNEFDRWMAEQNPQIERQRRAILGNGAALGRLGSGMLAEDFNGLMGEFDLNARNERSRLFDRALEGSIGDQFDKTNTLSGIAGDLYGREANTRSNAAALGESGANAEMANRTTALNASRGLLDDANTENRSLRDEVRGERGYQVGRDDAAYGRNVDLYNAETSAQQRAFDNAMRTAGLGFSGNPSDAVSRAGEGAGDMSQLLPLIMALSQNRATTGGSGAPTMDMDLMEQIQKMIGGLDL
jgi:hypothetical protein